MARAWVPAATICCILLCGAIFGQTTETKTKFEVADIHASPATNQPFVRGPFHSNREALFKRLKLA